MCGRGESGGSERVKGKGEGRAGTRKVPGTAVHQCITEIRPLQITKDMLLWSESLLLVHNQQCTLLPSHISSHVDNELQGALLHLYKQQQRCPAPAHLHDHGGHVTLPDLLAIDVQQRNVAERVTCVIGGHISMVDTSIGETRCSSSSSSQPAVTCSGMCCTRTPASSSGRPSALRSATSTWPCTSPI